jgi:hypothetical protein
MSSTSATNARPSANACPEPIKRRGLLAAMAALVAGVVGKVTERPVSAGTDGDVVLGADNVTQTTTQIRGPVNTAGLVVGADGPPAAIVGFNSRDAGVLGIHQGTSRLGPGLIGAGVWGYTTSSQGAGVFGGGRGTNGIGVLGISGSTHSVVGRVVSDSPASGSAGVYGLNEAQGFGIYGQSVNAHAVVGATLARGHAGIVGATNGVPGTAAGAFFGDVFVRGSLTVAGGAKSAAVPHPDGGYRRLYCMESPESWFEDFGDAQLTCGRAEVTFDPEFAALVDLSNYRVFLTEQETHQHVIVKNRTATGFTVEADVQLAALKGTTPSELNGAFSWRVVAKRKDIPGERLATVTIPAEPALPDAPPPVPSMPEWP